MTREREQLKAVEQIRKKYGKVIDIEKNPLVLVEIIRQHGRTFLEVGDHNLNPSVSTVAVGVNDGGGGGGGGGGADRDIRVASRLRVERVQVQVRARTRVDVMAAVLGDRGASGRLTRSRLEPGTRPGRGCRRIGAWRPSARSGTG